MGLIIGPSKSHSSYSSYVGFVIVALGSEYQCGRIICKNGGIAWIVAPYCSEVSRSWYLRDDAVTTALACTAGATGWFVPSMGQLCNPGYLCRTFWGPTPCYSSTYYWSSTVGGAPYACLVLFTTGGAYFDNSSTTRCVRAFRCVTY